MSWTTNQIKNKANERTQRFSICMKRKQGVSNIINNVIVLTVTPNRSNKIYRSNKTKRPNEHNETIKTNESTILCQLL